MAERMFKEGMRLTLITGYFAVKFLIWLVKLVVKGVMDLWMAHKQKKEETVQETTDPMEELLMAPEENG